MKELHELNKIGYSLELDSDENIIYRLVSESVPGKEKKRIIELFRYIKEHKAAAVKYLREHPGLAFVEVPICNHPFKENGGE